MKQNQPTDTAPLGESQEAKAPSPKKGFYLSEQQYMELHNLIGEIPLKHSFALAVKFDAICHEGLHICTPVQPADGQTPKA